MKKLIFTTLFAALFLACFAQKPRMVVFYNLENLFDTINDPNINDEEFLPDSPRKWNSYKYNTKLSNIEQVLFDIALINKEYPAVIGVSEIENKAVLEDLVSQPKLAPGKYGIVHYDSPDARGVDVAFLYRPDIFKLEGSQAIKFNMPGMPNFRTRDFVTMWGTIDNEPFFFLVSHWPSRLGGKAASSPKREAAAAQCRHIADSVRKANPATKVVIMGDLNDDATDKSIVEVLGAKAKIKNLEEGDMYNPFIDVLKAGYGTLAYQDCMEPVRQHHHLRQPRNRIYRQTQDPERKGLEILRQHIYSFVHDPERRPIQRLSVAHIRWDQLPGRILRPLPRIHLHRNRRIKPYLYETQISTYFDIYPCLLCRLGSGRRYKG